MYHPSILERRESNKFYSRDLANQSNIVNTKRLVPNMV
jgi:hypothetical protein